jgi:hypothetical protein
VGNPTWEGKRGELQITYDELIDEFRAFQSVIVDSPPTPGQDDGEEEAGREFLQEWAADHQLTDA